ncbi:SH3 domain-containing protein 19-like [Ylistrum balloti]|uniref:SH3 domain-containing protein 19-like n=1 Tax=Ylistrum balloti TaxID=509963 RepID=UPI002905DC9B|nr:SH3 domain-containing protein 19-like [Ylistrum balloti]
MAEGGVTPQHSLKPPPRKQLPDVPQRPSVTDLVRAPSTSIPRVPSRSAPPIPGGSAPPKPPDPGGRVPPKPPSKPPASTLPGSQPVPLRGDSSRLKSDQTKIPPRPASTSGDKTTTKRRPEITIICARPMSEVGFRDQSNNSNSSTSSNQSKPPTEVPPRTDKKDDSSPPSGRPPRLPPQIPSRLPPPSSSSIHGPPPSPRPRVAARNSSSISDETLSSNPEQTMKSDETIQREEPIVPLKPISLSNSQGDITSDNVTVQTQFKKPLRPTIIRPQKKVSVPNSKEEESPRSKVATSGVKEQNIKGDNIDTENSEKSSVPPVLRPKPAARERPKSMSIADSVKRFETKTDTHFSMSVTAGNKPPPPLTPKPKPNVLPKPNKINHTSSSSVSSTPTSAVVSPVDTSEQLPVDQQQNQDINVTKTADESLKPVMPATKASKRPTIIRAPPKPKRSILNSTGDEEEDLDIVKEDKKVEESLNVVERRHCVKSTADDCLVNKSNKAPPLPKKRPVSIASIPDGFSLQGNVQGEESNQVINVDQFRPKPATRANVTSEEKKSDGVTRPKIIGRPPPPSVKTNQDSDGKKPSRPVAPASRPKSAVYNLDSQEDISDCSSPSQGDHLPPRPTSFDPRPRTKPESSKPPVGRPPPPQPREMKTLPVDYDGTVKVKETGEGKPPTSMAPTRPPPAASSSIGNSRGGDKPEKPQPPRPASMRKTSMPQPLAPGEPFSPPSLPPRPTPGHPLYHYMAGVPHGVALHDFDGVHEGDLSFKAADTVLLVGRMDESWLQGRVGNREGIFPAEFIQIVIPLSDQSPAIGPDRTAEPIQAWGDDNYEKVDSQSLKKPDLIGQGPRCCARFDFDGEGEKDLQFEEGDYIRLLEKLGDEWAEGEINGRTGIFPLVYVEIIEDLPLKKTEETPQISEVSGNLSSPISAESKPQSPEEFPVSIVMYNFDGSDPGDLPLKVGDKVKVIGIVNEEWLYGQVQEQCGQFPASFIDPVPKDLTPYHPEVKTVTQNTTNENLAGQESDLPLDTYCVALHAFSGEGDDELSFSEGDRILILENLGPDWCRGTINNKTGMFPSNFVEKVQQLPGYPLPETPSDVKLPVQYGRAMYDFDAEGSNELKLQVGDRVLLGEHVAEALDWRWGEIAGHRGIFPAAFVEPE